MSAPRHLSITKLYEDHVDKLKLSWVGAVGAERRIDILIGDNRQFPSDNRQDELAADHVCIAFIRRIDSHCGIAEDRLRSGSRDCYKFIRVVLQRIAHVVQLAGRLLMLHLDIRQSCVAARTPVCDAFALVNQPFFIQ